jgi:hypothetical protein
MKYLVNNQIILKAKMSTANEIILHELETKQIIVNTRLYCLLEIEHIQKLTKLLILINDGQVLSNIMFKMIKLHMLMTCLNEYFCFIFSVQRPCYLFYAQLTQALS